VRRVWWLGRWEVERPRLPAWWWKGWVGLEAWMVEGLVAGQ
jgi:hypothetical protein